MPMEFNVATGNKNKIESAVQLNKIKPGTMIITDDSNEIAFAGADGKVDFLKDTLGESVAVNGVNVGGITDGTVLDANMTFLDFAKKMLQKAIPVVYTKPTISIANNGGQASGNVETGTSITAKLKATFTQNDAGSLTALKISKNGEVVATETTSAITYQGSAFNIGDESAVFKATAEYEEGEVKKNNLGEDSPDGHITAGSISSSNYTITGKRKLFYGTGVGSLPSLTSAIIRGLSNNKLAPTEGLTFTINVAVGQQYIIFAYESTLRDVKQVKYEETNDATLAQNFDKSIVKVADARGGNNNLKDYKVYSYCMAVPAPASMTLTVTI